MRCYRSEHAVIVGFWCGDLSQVLDRSENPVAQRIVEAEYHYGNESYKHDDARSLLHHLAAGRPGNLLRFFYNFLEEYDRTSDDVSRFFRVSVLGAFRLLRGICVGALHLILVLGSRLFGHSEVRISYELPVLFYLEKIRALKESNPQQTFWRRSFYH